MKALKTRTTNHHPALITLVVLAGLFALFVWTAISWAQSPIPHAGPEAYEETGEFQDCLACHQAGVNSAPRLASDHIGRGNEDCLICHQYTGAPASEIPHPVAGRDDCLSCHREGVGDTPRLSGDHVDYTNEKCSLCHSPSATALEPTPIPTPVPTPAAGPGHPGAETCVSCHQLIFADTDHALFTGQPLGDAEAGAILFADLCAHCHGEDGTTPVGDENRVINSEAYWSTHDDATILRAIGAGSEGKMTAFAEAYNGPLSWEQILDLAALVRSWGPVAMPETPTQEGPTYTNTIGPLLTEKCGLCHGGIAGLTTTDYKSLMAGSSSGPVVVPGDPDGSRIVEVQRGEHYAQLQETELNILIEWIANGAPEQ